MNGESRILLEQQRIGLIIRRMAYQIWETWDDMNRAAIIGLQPRGVTFARMLHQELRAISGVEKIPFGMLDTTFHRDDFRRKNEPLIPSQNQMEFLVEGLNIILADDVLYTGRSVRAALDALTAYGRPASVVLATLVDRRFSRELPIEANFSGITVDTRANDRVMVNLEVNGTQNHVLIVSQPQ